MEFGGDINIDNIQPMFLLAMCIYAYDVVLYCLFQSSLRHRPIGLRTIALIGHSSVLELRAPSPLSANDQAATGHTKVCMLS